MLSLIKGWMLFLAPEIMELESLNTLHKDLLMWSFTHTEDNSNSLQTIISILTTVSVYGAAAWAHIVVFYEGLALPLQLVAGICTLYKK